MSKLFNSKKSKAVECTPNEIKLCTSNGILKIVVKDNESLLLNYVDEPDLENLGYRFVNEDPNKMMHMIGYAIAAIKYYFGADHKGTLDELQNLINNTLNGEGDIVINTLQEVQIALFPIIAFANAKYDKANREYISSSFYSYAKSDVVTL